MNIDLHNYEEFFLLYADGELDTAGRRQVEEFVGQYPDLRKDLTAILSTIQQPEDMPLADKSFLLKHIETEFINDQNYPAQFVAYFDGELGRDEERQVEAFARSDGRLEKEFLLTGKSKLAPEMGVHFPDKKILYRPAVRLKYIKMARVAAAAAMVGLTIWLGGGLISNPAGEPSSEIITKKADNRPRKQPVQTTPLAAPMQKGQAGNIADKTTGQGHGNGAAKETSKSGEKMVVRPELVATGFHNNEQPERKVTKPSDNISPGEEQTGNTLLATHEVSAGLPADYFGEAAEKDLHGLAIAQQTRPLASLDEEKFAVSLNVPSEGKEVEYVFIDEPDRGIERSKLGIWFKKVKRTVERTNPVNRLLNIDNEN